LVKHLPFMAETNKDHRSRPGFGNSKNLRAGLRSPLLITVKKLGPSFPINRWKGYEIPTIQKKYGITSLSEV
jgi:hypothetical protein